LMVLAWATVKAAYCYLILDLWPQCNTCSPLCTFYGGRRARQPYASSSCMLHIRTGYDTAGLS
jgi:hypothetical protein